MRNWILRGCCAVLREDALYVHTLYAHTLRDRACVVPFYSAVS